MAARKPREQRAEGVLNEEEDGSLWNILWVSLLMVSILVSKLWDLGSVLCIDELG